MHTARVIDFPIRVPGGNTLKSSTIMFLSGSNWRSPVKAPATIDSLRANVYNSINISTTDCTSQNTSTLTSPKHS
jgi:hypothetical protein